MTPPTRTGLEPGGPPCFSEWSTDAGTTPSDSDYNTLTLVRDALTFSLA